MSPVAQGFVFFNSTVYPRVFVYHQTFILEFVQTFIAAFDVKLWHLRLERTALGDHARHDVVVREVSCYRRANAAAPADNPERVYMDVQLRHSKVARRGKLIDPGRGRAGTASGQVLNTFIR